MQKLATCMNVKDLDELTKFIMIFYKFLQLFVGFYNFGYFFSSGVHHTLCITHFSYSIF